jgi:hypothetical protein
LFVWQFQNPPLRSPAPALARPCARPPLCSPNLTQPPTSPQQEPL